jgi:hypothetical protein
MNILINHCWCSDSNWGGCYDCRVIVTLHRVPEGKTYYDAPCPDWVLVEEHPFKSKEDRFRFTTVRARADVLEWLNTNVKDRKLIKWQIQKGESAKGWSVGTDEYNSATGISFSFFFEREHDGMNFIKHWSVYKKPTYYCQYFKDIRKELDFKTGKLIKI